MSYECKILLDSISETGKRITTFQVTFPRCVLAEAETHRVLRGWGGNIEEFIIHNLGINVDENLSRNSASSRAIPINKMLKMVEDDPFIPEKFGKPVKGMGAKEYWPLDSQEHSQLTYAWEQHLSRTRILVRKYAEVANKEDLNRLLEPFMYHTAIITATEFDNFFKLRTAEGADWKIRKIADLMYEAYHAFNNDIQGTLAGTWDAKGNPEWSAIRPQKLKVGEWHCPLIDNQTIQEVKDYRNRVEEYTEEFSRIELIKKISVARCARISYLTHDGKRDIEKDLELFERLRTSGHWSPFEHVATPAFTELDYEMDANFEGEIYTVWSDQKRIFHELHNSNFIGWKQYRKEFQDENYTNFKKEN